MSKVNKANELETAIIEASLVINQLGTLLKVIENSVDDAETSDKLMNIVIGIQALAEENHNEIDAILYDLFKELRDPARESELTEMAQKDDYVPASYGAYHTKQTPVITPRLGFYIDDDKALWKDSTARPVSEDDVYRAFYPECDS